MTDTPTNAPVSEVTEAMIKQAWADFVNCRDDQYFGNRTKMKKQFTVLRKFAAAITAMSARSPGWEAEAVAMVKRIHDRAHDAPLPSEYILDEAADLLQKMVGIKS